VHYSINDDILFDFIRREQTITTLEKNKKEFAVSTFLDDISSYMEENKRNLQKISFTSSISSWNPNV